MHFSSRVPRLKKSWEIDFLIFNYTFAIIFVARNWLISKWEKVATWDSKFCKKILKKKKYFYKKITIFNENFKKIYFFLIAIHTHTHTHTHTHIDIHFFQHVKRQKFSFLREKKWNTSFLILYYNTKYIGFRPNRLI